MVYVVTTKWLKSHLDSGEIAIIDVRFQMDAPEAGRISYLAGHIPHAIYLDLNKDLSGPVKEHGGQHPLPEIDELSEKLGEGGVDQNKTVVIYDQGDCMFASRAWWLLNYLGHKDVYILNGGFNAWLEAGNPVSHKVTAPIPTKFTPEILVNATVDIEGVKDRKDRTDTILIDSRAYDRYVGKSEPLYHKAGHIPGAKSFFWKNVFNKDGTWKDTDQLKKTFEKLPKDAEIIVSCGSGVSACPNIIGLKTAGFENVKLYPGSFSDWISYPENELETKEE